MCQIAIEKTLVILRRPTRPFQLPGLDRVEDVRDALDFDRS